MAKPRRAKTIPRFFVTSGGGGAGAGIYRSDDVGTTGVKINDAQHQWGSSFGVISGDPRIYGRVYIGTNGRGILYGDIAN